jgi:hypothetical protein
MAFVSAAKDFALGLYGDTQNQKIQQLAQQLAIMPLLLKVVFADSSLTPRSNRNFQHTLSQNSSWRCIMIQRCQDDMKSEPERWPNS